MPLDVIEAILREVKSISRVDEIEERFHSNSILVRLIGRT